MMLWEPRLPRGISAVGETSRDRLGPVAFTLVEVMVVISIIGLLLAILLPSMARSRENARAVLCRGNLVEWGRGMFVYADLHRGWLPYEDRGEEALGRFCWFDVMKDIFNTATIPESVRACPTVLRSDPEREESYRMNSKLAETNPNSEHYLPYRRLNTLARPGQTVLLFDGDVGGGRVSFKGRWRVRGDDVNYRHNDATNILFADWHVEMFRTHVVREKSIRNAPLVWQPEDMGPWNADPKGR
ncbi:MAG: prepilin-type N-terminal cleavage/methylation domain-containing protein [bacterium]|nr:prepilin-type N-terminal cleavage/methylation domain-containing protein [bacterium]